MGWISGIVVYILIWWLVFFMSLPVGVTAQHEHEDGAVPGTPESAPVQPRIWWKALASALVAGVIFALYYYAQAHHWFGLFGNYFTVFPE